MEILTVKETAKLLRCSTKTVYRMIERGKLGAFRLGGAVRIRGDSVSQLINEPPLAIPKRPSVETVGSVAVVPAAGLYL